MTGPFGPLSAEEFQQAIDAPFGGAADILRKHDPLWGKLSPDGAPIKWKVRLEQEVTMVAFLTVEAATAEDAIAIAEETADKARDLGWDFDSDGPISVLDAVPA